METILIILIVLVIIGFVLILGELRKQRKPVDSEGMLMLQEQVQDLSKTVDNKLSDSSKQTQQIIKDITQQLTKVGEGQKQVAGFADQLRDLQDILKNPKQRGILGEYYLEALLKNVLPPGSFEVQHTFPNGLVADAVIFVKDKIIPVDSKFSLENYNKIVKEKDPTERERLEKLFRQDLKKRIDETSKYVNPNHNTMDFAFMFIPHEAIYYDLLVNQIGAVKVNTQDLIEYAFKERKVIIVSPTSFLAYLQTVLQGLRALKIEESAKDIRKRVEDLGRHLKSYDSFMQKLGGHLGTTVSMYNQSYKEFKKIDKDVLRITDKGVDVETVELDKPKDLDGVD